jgi:DNA modification methylase
MKTVDDRPDKNKTVKHEIPKMPEGYYSGDKPNPNLRKFVEDHMREHPYDPTKDDYNVPAFDKPIEATRATAIYNMHTYWSKKPHDAIRQYIQHYTKTGDLVLDQFCGSGGTALAALMDGQAAIAIDRSPAATFITKNYCTPVDVRELQFAFEELKVKVKPEIDWLYETRCDRCGGKATTAYTVYSQVFQCPRCMAKVPLFDCVEVEIQAKVQKSGQPIKMKKANACPHCYKNGNTEIIRSQSKKFGAIPVLVSYICSNGCKPARDERRYNDINQKKRDFFEKYDIGKINEIKKREIPYWYPKDYDMTKFDRYQRDALFYYEIKEVSDLFTKRNLWSLALIFKQIQESLKFKDELLFIFTSILLKSSRMMAHNNDGIGRIQKGTYYIPQISHDIHVMQFYQEATGDMISGWRQINLRNSDLLVSTSDARQISAPNDSVDFIFTDPPYSEKTQYGELNYVWETWLGFDTDWYKDEIIVNEVQGKTEREWAEMMLQAMKESYRVLKPGRWISLCYHDTSDGTWSLLQDIMAEAGFIVDTSDSALFIDTKTKTTNQYFADKVNKRDLVINFRKPRPGEVTGTLIITGDEDTTTFSQKVAAIIRDYLSVHPGTTKDRIYDEVVSRMVRAGQMEAHNFEELLGRVAEPNKPEGSTGNGLRWYLKETELNAVDSAETIKEDAAYEKMAKFVTEFLQKHPENEGVHYSDLFEHYIYAVKDKPRRALVDWLLDYFYKTEEGTYRLPITDEEKKIKSEGRAKGIARRIRHYIAHLEQGIPIREQDRPSDTTLADWLRHCRRAGLFEQGKVLYEKGGIRLDHLSENQQVAVDEDYMVCVRNLARGVGKAPAATKRKKKNDVLTV